MLICSTTPESADLVSAMLFGSGATAIVEYELSAETIDLHAGFPTIDDALVAADEVRSRAECRLADSTDPSWVENQRDGLEPMTSGSFHVRAPWHDASPQPDGSTELIIDPGAAFGHGAHPTTSMILELLPDVIGAGDDIIDIGTGTAVLAIAAATLGANVLAVDNDPTAIDIAHANVALNAVAASVELALSDGATILYARNSECTTALINMTMDGQRHVAAFCQSIPNIVVSGVLDTQDQEMLALYPAHTCTRRLRRDRWYALVLSR